MQLSSNKAVFLSKVFAHLILQSLIAYTSAKTIIENKELSDSVARNMLLYVIGYVVAILAFAFSRNIITKFVFFTILSILTGIFWSRTGDGNVKEALMDAVSIFIGMFVLGVITHLLGYDLRVLGPVLFVGLVALILARLFTGASYSKIVVGLFALFVVYDTNVILSRNYGNDFVSASFDYFVDILNIFGGLVENE